MLDLDLDSLLGFLRANPWLALVLVYFMAAFLRALARGKKGSGAGPRGAATPERRMADADLQERVRAGFEQMMRERAAGRTATAQAPRAAVRPAAAAAAAPLAPPQRALRPPPPAPRVAPSNVATPKAAPPPPPLPISAAKPAAPTPTGLPASLLARGRMMQRTASDVSVSRARRLLKDRSSLRGAVLASEILGRPLALREPA